MRATRLVSSKSCVASKNTMVVHLFVCPDQSLLLLSFRSHCQQWENRKVSPWPGDQILCQSKCFLFHSGSTTGFKGVHQRDSNSKSFQWDRGEFPCCRTDPVWVGVPRKYAVGSAPHCSLESLPPWPAPSVTVLLATVLETRSTVLHLWGTDVQRTVGTSCCFSDILTRATSETF